MINFVIYLSKASHSKYVASSRAASVEEGDARPEWYVKKQIGGNLSMEKQIKTIGVLTSGGDALA